MRSDEASSADTDVIVTIDRGASPGGRESMALTTACVRKTVPRRLTAMIASKFAGARSRRSPRTTAPMPALLTRQSMRPNSASVRSTNGVCVARSAMSPG
jgi:hypothetical protein